MGRNDQIDRLKESQLNRISRRETQILEELTKRAAMRALNRRVVVCRFGSVVVAARRLLTTACAASGNLGGAAAVVQSKDAMYVHRWPEVY